MVHSKMTTKDYPKDYSNDARRVLETMSLGPGLQINGTSAYRDMLYASDFDGYEIVKVASVADAVKRFQHMIQDVLRLDNVFIADIKCGEVPEWDLWKGVGIKGGHVVNYNPIKIKQHASELLKAGIVKSADYKHLLKHLKPTLTPLDLMNAKQAVKAHVVRWTPSDVLRGYTTLPNGKHYTLATGMTTPSLTKVDTIGYVAGNRYTEFSVIYDLRQGRKLLNSVASSKDSVVGSIELDVLAFAHEGNYFKALKRIMAWARLRGDKALQEHLTPILNSDLGRLSSIAGDIQTLEDLLERYTKVPEDDVKFEIDQFIARLSNVSLPQVVKANLPATIKAIEKLPLSKIRPKLSLLRGRISRFLQEKARPLAEPLIRKID